MCSRCYWFRYMACSRVFLRHTLMEMNWSYAARRLMILAMWSSEVWGVQDFCALGFCLTKGWYVPAWSYWYQGWSYSIISGLVLFVLSHPLFWCLFASLLRLPGHCFFFFFCALCLLQSRWAHHGWLSLWCQLGRLANCHLGFMIWVFWVGLLLNDCMHIVWQYGIYYGLVVNYCTLKSCEIGLYPNKF